MNKEFGALMLAGLASTGAQAQTMTAQTECRVEALIIQTNGPMPPDSATHLEGVFYIPPESAPDSLTGVYEIRLRAPPGIMRWGHREDSEQVLQGLRDLAPKAVGDIYLMECDELVERLKKSAELENKGLLGRLASNYFSLRRVAPDTIYQR
jgi:hypothetical protein